MTTNKAAYLENLHQLLNEHFNLVDIQNFCFRLNINYESVPDSEKSSRIRALLLGLGQNGHLSELVALAQKLRPHIDWPPLPDDFELPESLSSSSMAAPTNQYHVYGDVVHGDKIGGDKIGGDKITNIYQLSPEHMQQLLIAGQQEDYASSDLEIKPWEPQTMWVQFLPTPNRR